MRLNFRNIAAALWILVAAAPAVAFDVFLDYNTDEDPYTFVNAVDGPETVPIDIVVSFDEADLDLPSIMFFVNWGYEWGDPCYTVVGKVYYGFEQGAYLPDMSVFTNIFAYTCICRELRCSCASYFIIDADISGLTEPGNYVIARLDFSRWGTFMCWNKLWALAEFQTNCYSPDCANPEDPRTILTMQGKPTSIEDNSWGKVKALYR
jgi:hypothetical protein